MQKSLYSSGIKLHISTLCVRKQEEICPAWPTIKMFGLCRKSIAKSKSSYFRTGGF